MAVSTVDVFIGFSDYLFIYLFVTAHEKTRLKTQFEILCTMPVYYKGEVFILFLARYHFCEPDVN